MYRKILLIVSLVAGAVLLWIFSGTYPTLPLPDMAKSLAAVAATYLFVKVFLSEVIFRAIEDKKTRYTANKVSSIPAIMVLLVILARIRACR
jgi:hypothetical protein